MNVNQVPEFHIYYVVMYDLALFYKAGFDLLNTDSSWIFFYYSARFA